MKTTLSFFSFKKGTTRTFFSMLVLLVASCSDDDPGLVRVTDKYCTETKLDCSKVMPDYNIGDYWIGDDGVKTEVTGTTVIDGKTYYVIEWYPLEVQQITLVMLAPYTKGTKEISCLVGLMRIRKRG
jgi:hypothetical protein